MENVYWKITEKTGYRDSMRHLGFRPMRIDAILSRLSNSSEDDYIVEGIRKRGFFYVSVENDGTKFEWNDYDCYGPEGYNFRYMGEVFLRKQKLEKLKNISDGGKI